MQTRLAKITDLPTLVKFDREVNLTAWSQQEYCESLSNNSQYIYLATDNDKIIGCIVYSIVLDEAEILQFWVAKGYQNAGYGRQLLIQLLRRLSYVHQAKRVFLEVRDSNEIAIKLYHNLAFVEVGKRTGYYNVDGWQFDAIVMLKQLG